MPQLSRSFGGDGVFSFHVTGVDEVSRRTQKLMERYKDVANRALYHEGKIELDEAKRRTPYDTGALHDSGKLTRVTISRGEDYEIKITFGEGGVFYALRVHEDLEMNHAPGKIAKFLETVLQESYPHMAERIGKHFRAMLREKGIIR